MFVSKKLLKIGSAGAALGVGVLLLSKKKKQNNLRNPNETEACHKLGLLTPNEAQYTKVYKIPSFLTHEEIQNLKSAIKELQKNKKVGVIERDSKGHLSSFKDAVWKTSFLHTNNQLKCLLPELHVKIKNTMLTIDKKEWKQMCHDENDLINDKMGSVNSENKIISKLESINLRTIESHEYVAKGQLERTKHYDAGSIITMDIMLNDSGNEFKGGELSFPQFDTKGKAINTDTLKLEKGDAALFLSHKYHNVLPVTSGKRHVLVIELWNG